MKQKKSPLLLCQSISIKILMIRREQVKQEMEEELNEENSNDSATLQSSENVDGKNGTTSSNVGNTIEQENDEQEEEQDPSKVEETTEPKDLEEKKPATMKKKQGTGFRTSVKCIDLDSF